MLATPTGQETDQALGTTTDREITGIASARQNVHIREMTVPLTSTSEQAMHLHSPPMQEHARKVGRATTTMRPGIGAEDEVAMVEEAVASHGPDAPLIVHYYAPSASPLQSKCKA